MGSGESKKERIEEAIRSIEDVKEKIALAMDTCCFASVDLDYDEFELLVRNLEDVIELLNSEE